MWKGRVSFSIVEEFTLQEMAERLMNSNAIRVGGNIQIGEAAAVARLQQNLGYNKE